MALKTCEICGKPILVGDPCRFSKAKGQRLRWYHEKCVKGGGKNGHADGKRH